MNQGGVERRLDISRKALPDLSSPIALQEFVTVSTFRLVALMVASFAGTLVANPLLAHSSPPVLLQMIRDDAIHDELNLTADQRDSILRALPAIDGRWFRARNLKSDEQGAEIDRLTAEMKQQLGTIIDSPRLARLEQLERQALGTRMFGRDDVATRLQLSDAQRKVFMDTFVNTDNKSAEIQKQLRSSEIDGREAQRKIDGLKNKERQAIVNQLTNDQKSKLSSLTGSPFNFASVKRMYPLAPELSSEGVTWIQGGPLKLSELRGKVVAVHYYAFQCINCRRNFPHYKAWHDDFKDKDLVIIGIQTPETSAERSLERVTQAAKNDGIEYPVLLDSKGSNWNTWSNTMWPTVYLIDKKGFIRRWWQGEMNWQGTPGEQQMRQTIETLLAEES